MTRRARTSTVAGAAASSGVVQLNAITPIAQRSMFWRPDYLAESAWVEHIPFAFWLVEAYRPQVLVELGTHYGVSYFAFCQAADRLGLDTRCFAVDTWRGDKHSGLYDERVFEKVKAHNDARYSGFSRLVRSSFDDALEHFEDGTIDLLHIDGLHTFEAVRHDFAAWLPKLSRRAIVLLHDTNVREQDFGVVRLFETLKSRYPHFEFVHGHGLGVLGVGADQTDTIQRLFQAHTLEQTRQAIHEVFARLGRACADSLAVASQQERALVLAEEIDRQKGELEQFRRLLETTKTDLAEHANELDGARARLRGQIEQHATERGHLAERIKLLQELRTELKEEVARLNARIEATSAELAEKSQQLATLIRQNGEHQQRIEAANESVRERDRAIKELTQKLNARMAAQTQEQEKAQAQIRQLDASRQQMERAVHSLFSDKQAQAKSIEDRYRELAVLTKMLADRDGEVARLEAEKAKLTSEHARELMAKDQALHAEQRRAAQLQHTLSWKLATPVRVLERLFIQSPEEGTSLADEISLIAESGLFDEAWYRTRNPDVAGSALSPIEHYLRQGSAAGGNPGPGFDAQRYLATYRDVAEAGINPLVHYIRCGRQEGRTAHRVEEDND